MKKLLFLTMVLILLTFTACGEEVSSSAAESSSSEIVETSSSKPKTNFVQVDDVYKVQVKTMSQKIVTLSISGFKDNKGANITYICTKKGDKFELVISKTGIAELDEYGTDGYVNVNLPCPAVFGFTVKTKKNATSGPYLSIVYDTEKGRLLEESILFGESSNAIISISREEAIYSAKLLTKACNIFNEFIKANNL